LAEQAEERSWVERARQGDDEAIGWLYRRYAPAVFRYLFYRLGEREVAEDLTSEVFVRAIEGLPRYQQRGLPFAAWLYRIAAARVVDHYRRMRRRPATRLQPESATSGERAEQEAESRLSAEELQRGLAGLPPAYQQVIVLRFVEGLSHEEVAQVMGRSAGAVRVLQYRALAALRRQLEKGL